MHLCNTTVYITTHINYLGISFLCVYFVLLRTVDVKSNTNVFLVVLVIISKKKTPELRQSNNKKRRDWLKDYDKDILNQFIHCSLAPFPEATQDVIDFGGNCDVHFIYLCASKHRTHDVGHVTWRVLGNEDENDDM